MKDFEPEATLWDVLTYWDMQQDRYRTSIDRTSVLHVELHTKILEIIVCWHIYVVVQFVLWYNLFLNRFIIF